MTTSNELLKLEEYILSTENFNNEERFVDLLVDGLSLLEIKPSKFATEDLQVIPSTVSRWMLGKTKPAFGMQKVVIMKLRNKALKAAKAINTQ